MKVECHSGHKADERPVAFWLGERRLVVVELRDRWYTPEGSGFRVLADDGLVYVLRHFGADDSWTLETTPG
jgi:hypothetical protein